MEREIGTLIVFLLFAGGCLWALFRKDPAIERYLKHKEGGKE